MPSRRHISSKKPDAPRSRSLTYPGYYVKVGVKDHTVVRAVQRRLNDLGCGPISFSGTFDRQTKAAVQLFQARSVNARGQALKIDGVIGPSPGRLCLAHTLFRRSRRSHSHPWWNAPWALLLLRSV